jgi:hypothetical protein
MKLPFWHKGTATKSDDNTSPLDEIQGAGMLDAIQAYNQLAAGHWQNGNVAPTGWDNNIVERNGIENIYKIQIVDPNEEYIAATLTWNKHYQDGYPFNVKPSAQSNLRLELWAVDPEDPSKDYIIDYSDSDVDNVEHVYCKADPNFTHYQIIISCKPVALKDMRISGLNERYGLAWRTASTKWIRHPWWDDLNGDGKKDELDEMIYTVMKSYPPILAESAFANDLLKLSDERLELLKQYFDQWKQYTTFDN